MVYQIAKSVIDGLPYNYAEEVEKFRQAKLVHRFTGDIAPSAPAIIEHAVRRVPVDGQADDFVTDFEVIDDVPVPTLNERKAALVGRIRAMEVGAAAKVISSARERLMGLDLNAVYLKPEAERSDSDRALIAKSAEIGARKAALHRHATELEIEVEDLTEAAIDGWEPKPFPEA